ncbi:hypothetical protein TVAG_114330 [Trichomonas vaginalis G3]|uniref:Uncharacterized protein n=1 Tax=Trichomonas vaginalis (strain ATCC PRA-98 / G3) TaxID=412133 RepID=A2F3W0_TRIV3|nr:hypothetical protein TVAG_114330 [Trichomonas vaginalis G3]|eukprot:XP_001313358.1 hypothetical protein [Trichomonas vaginalis G3]
MSSTLQGILGYNLSKGSENKSEEYLEDEKPQYVDATTQQQNDAFAPIPMPPSPEKKTEAEEPPKEQKEQINDNPLNTVFEPLINKVEEQKEEATKPEESKQDQPTETKPEENSTNQEKADECNDKKEEETNQNQSEDNIRTDVNSDTELNINIKKLIPTLPEDETENAENKKQEEPKEDKQEPINEIKENIQQAEEQIKDKENNEQKIEKKQEENPENQQENTENKEEPEKKQENQMIAEPIHEIQEKVLEIPIQEEKQEEKTEDKPEEAKEEEKPVENEEKTEEKEEKQNLEEKIIIEPVKEIKEEIKESVDNTPAEETEKKQEENNDQNEESKTELEMSELIKEKLFNSQDDQNNEEKENDSNHSKNSSSRSSKSRHSMAEPLPPLPNDENENNDDSDNHTETFITTDDTPLIFNYGQQPYFDPKAVEKAYNDFAKHGAPPPQNLRPGIVQYINRKKATALMDSDYDLAEQLDQQMIELSRLGNENGNDYHSRLKSLDTRTSDLQGEKKAMEEKWREKLQKHEEECEIRLEKLKEKQLQELEEQKAKWQSQEYCRQFSKPSIRLLQLRHQEKKMALSRRYHDAKVTKKLADDLQSQEEKQAEQLLEESIRKEIGMMREKHWREEEKLREYNEKTRNDLETQKARELEPYDSAMKAITHKKSEKPNPKFTKLPINLTSAIAAQTSTMNPQPTIATPRTVSRMKQFRTEKKGNLNLTPVDDETLSRAQKMSRMNPTPRGSTLGSRNQSRQPTRMNSPTKRPKTNSDSRFPKL